MIDVLAKKKIENIRLKRNVRQILNVVSFVLALIIPSTFLLDWTLAPFNKNPYEITLHVEIFVCFTPYTFYLAPVHICQKKVQNILLYLWKLHNEKCSVPYQIRQWKISQKCIGPRFNSDSSRDHTNKYIVIASKQTTKINKGTNFLS